MRGIGWILGGIGVLGAIFVATGCEEAACGFGESGAFRSVDERECGLGPDGVVMCQWQLNFAADGTFSWMYSDIGESGIWSCEDGQISASAADRAIPASYDAAAGELTWDGVVYVRE